MRPAGADIFHDPRDLLHAARAGVDVRGPKLGRQKVPAAKNIERQITVAVVITVEEAALLVTVHWVVGGIQIKNDLPWRPRMRLQEQPHQQGLDRRPVIGDLVVARRFRPAQLQPVQGRLARHRRAVRASRLQFARQHRHDWIVAQIIVVVEVFIAERDGKHPLPHQRHHVVLDQVLATIIAKASGKTLHQSNRPIGGAKQKRSRIRRHQSSIEGGVHRAAFHDSKIKPFCATLCRHRGFLESLQKSLRHNNFR